MRVLHPYVVACVLPWVGASLSDVAFAQSDGPLADAVVSPRARPQGVAVVALATAKNEAFALAKAVYASALRPRSLDDASARVLAGEPASPTASKEQREMSELRRAITGDDVPSRQLLASLAQRTGAEALLVVRVIEAPETDAGAMDAKAPALVAHGSARLFLAESGEFDAARYEPSASGWQDTVSSVERRLLPVVVRAPASKPEPSKETAFYRSPWVWGALGAAALVGGIFFFASQDTSKDAIHLQLRVPR